MSPRVGRSCPRAARQGPRQSPPAALPVVRYHSEEQRQQVVARRATPWARRGARNKGAGGGEWSKPVLLLVLVLGFAALLGDAWTPPAAAIARRYLVMRGPVRPTIKKHTKVALPGGGGRDLLSLKVNEKLVGEVVGYKEVKGLGRRVFVDVKVTRKGIGDKFFPVFGMLRLLGPYANMTVTMGQRMDGYVDTVYPTAGRLTMSLTPVYRRPDVNASNGAVLPTYDLDDLKVGMPLTGMVVSHTNNSAFLDCGVFRTRNLPKPRRINGRVYRLDLEERFALAPKFKGPKTETVITPGLVMQMYVRNVHPESYLYRLTVDPDMTEEKAEAQQRERDQQRDAMRQRKDVSKLVLGTLRTAVITKILPNGGGVKVGIGAKKTAFVPISSLADAYGKEIKNLDQVVSVGGQLEVEIDSIDDEERIKLRCLRILKQPKGGKKKPPTTTTNKATTSPSSSSTAGSANKKQPPKKAAAVDDDDDDEWSYDDAY